MDTFSSTIQGAEASRSAGGVIDSPIDRGLGKDAFLKLLVAQLRNQNPLNPLHGTDFIAQTAQFSSLEQLQEINKSLATLAASSSSAGGSSIDAVLASGYIGKVVAANGTIIEQGEAGPATLRYNLPVGAASAQIQVRDLQGNLVRAIPLGPQPAGIQQLAFDGFGDDGRPLPAGRYVYQVVATDALGRSMTGVSTVSGQVTAVTFDGTHPYLVIGGNVVPLNAVYEISLAS